MIDIQEYIRRSREERMAHIDLMKPCYEIGGNSTQFKAALAYRLGTTIPSGRIMLCHACNNGACSNLKHLYWGTDADNNFDRVEFGKQGRVRSTKLGKTTRVPLAEYIQRDREERRGHLDLKEPCVEIGGNSWEFRGLLANHLGTAIAEKGVLLCHACNNGKCSNVKHLYWGSSVDNAVLDPKEAGLWITPWARLVNKRGEEEALRQLRSVCDPSKGGAGNKGKPKSPEHRAKIAASVKAQHEARIAAGLSGAGAGRGRTPEQRERISAGAKAYYAKQKELGLKPASYKATLSPEHRQKIKEAHQKRAARLREEKIEALRESLFGPPDPPRKHPEKD